jgi:predicted secreted protein
MQAMSTMATQPAVPMQQDDPERRRRVRRTTLVVTLIVLFFYFGFMALMLYRATHR